MSIPLHCLAYAVCPRFYDQNYLQKPAPGGTLRRAPNQDVEVMTGVLKAFERIADNKEEEKVIREQLNDFIMKKGFFALESVQADAASMEPIEWWCSYGSETPELAEVVKRVLSQPISSSSAERIWGTYQFIHNAKRNKLNAANADKLVFIHSNLCLQSRFTESYKSGPNAMWDAHPEDSTI
uniref:HAT C-terminal dimerisation domain-containing protein n=1 Tax=Oryza rufipogon TaxID=4529 RepID=A0A0E0QH06_ORYRU